MRIVVVSPPGDSLNEQRWVSALLDAGLERYHLRKPAWPEVRTASWLESLPKRYRGRIVLHTHHSLARRFGVLGVHFPDQDGPPERATAHAATFRSRSCHDLVAVERALGRFAAIFLGPVFSSFSKPGYGPMPEKALRGVSKLLAQRTQARTATEVIAIGGIARERLAECADLGFDGVAVIGAVWGARDPLAEFLSLQEQARASCVALRERSISQ